MQDDVERFLTRLRSTHPIIVTLFLNGGCYELYRLLREVWPEAEAWWDEHFHVQTKIGRHWYDIRGRRAGGGTGLVPIHPRYQHKAFRWPKSIKLGHLLEIEAKR